MPSEVHTVSYLQLWTSALPVCRGRSWLFGTPVNMFEAWLTQISILRKGRISHCWSACMFDTDPYPWSALAVCGKGTGHIRNHSARKRGHAHAHTHTQLYTHTHRHARACTRRTCGVDVDALAALEEHVHLAMHVAVLVLFCSSVGGMGIWAIGSVSTIQYPLAHF